MFWYLSGRFSINLDFSTWSNSHFPQKSKGHTRTRVCTRLCKHTQARDAQDPMFSGLPRSQVPGAYHNLEGMPSPPGTVTVARGPWSGG